MFYWSNCGCPEKYATGDFDSDKMRSQIDEAGEEKKRQDGSKFNFQRKGKDKNNTKFGGIISIVLRIIFFSFIHLFIQ